MTYYKSKYRAQKVERDGIRFDSKKEAKRYGELMLLKQNGQVDLFLRQVPIHLPGNIRYVIDFLVFYSDGTCAFEEVKGFVTPLAKLKIQQAEEILGVKINII